MAENENPNNNKKRSSVHSLMEGLNPNVVYKVKKKRKKKAPGVKSFFQTKKNFQGFDRHLCQYEDSIKDYVFVPKNYGERSQFRDNKYCTSCQLKPCIMIEHMDDIVPQATSELFPRKRSEVAVAGRMENYVKKLLVKYFGRDHVKRVGTPNCVIEETNSFTHDWLDEAPTTNRNRQRGELDTTNNL